MSMTDYEMRQFERRIEEKFNSQRNEFDSLRNEMRSLDWSVTKVFIAVLGLAPIVVFTYIVVLSLIPSKR